MSLRRKILFLALSVVFTVLACSTVAQFVDPPTPTETQKPASTQTPDPTSTLAPDHTLPPLPTHPEPTPTNTLVPIDQAQQRQIFDEFWTVVDEEYLYEDFNGLDWDAVYQEYTGRIAAGLTTEEFYFHMEELVYDLGDEHSVFLNPQVVAWEEAEYESGNDYVGIGIWIELVPERERAVILLTFPGSPAEQAGIRSRDSILSVEGQPALTADGDNLDLLDGVAGQPVTLTVQSPGEAPRQVTITRERIVGSLPVIAHLFTTSAGKNIGYLLIPTFSDGSIATQVGRALSELGDQTDLDGLIIDNRMNSGGYDNVMADTLGYFTSGLVGHFANRSGEMPLHVFRRNVSSSVDLPLVVLVGEGTASFAEIFSGILDDQGRAALIGETTLGNVEILWGYDFSDGSRAWLAHDTFIPTNNPDANWERDGLVPMVEIAAPWDLYSFEEDPAILAALDYLGGQ